MKTIAIVLSLAFAPASMGARLVELEEPAPAEVPPELTDAEARAHFSLGMKAWLADDHATAQRELEAAYAIQPAAVLLYALGQLERLQGRCDRARERFTAFLATDPPAAAAEDARANLERCGGALPEPEPPAPAIDPVPPEPAPLPQPAPPRRVDRLGIALAVVGSTLAATGLGLFGGAFVEQRRAGDANDVAAFDRGLQRARIEHATGLALTGVGTALLIGSIVRLTLARRRPAATHRSARVR